MRSPGVDHTLYPDDVERVGIGVAAAGFAVPGDDRRVRELDGAELSRAQEAAVLEMMAVISLDAVPIPVVDGKLLAPSPSVAVAGGAGGAADLMMSWTAEEMRPVPDPLG